jgi:hypothetical protein
VLLVNDASGNLACTFAAGYAPASMPALRRSVAGGDPQRMIDLVAKLQALETTVNTAPRGTVLANLLVLLEEAITEAPQLVALIEQLIALFGGVTK